MSLPVDPGADAPTLTPALPRLARIGPVGRCKLACRMCTVNERGDEVAGLSLARFTALLDRLPQGLRDALAHGAPPSVCRSCALYHGTS